MANNDETKLLDISWSSIIKISVAALALYVIYLIKDLLIWFIFGLIISVLFEPAIDYLNRKGIPRLAAVIVIYLGILSVLGISIYLTLPLLISEIQSFSKIFSHYFELLSPPLTKLGLEAFENLETFFKAINDTLGNAASSIFSGVFAIFGGIFSTIFIISLSVFLSLERNVVEKTLKIIFPESQEDYVMELWNRCRKKVTGWFGIRILAAIFVGLISYAVFLLFNVKYSFSLALMAGVFEIIPILGPAFTAVVAFLLVALESLPKAFFVLIFLILVQEIEGHILTPILSKKFIGVSPALILMALAIGGKLWGILGAILAIPLLGILFEFLKGFLAQRKKIKTSDQ